MFRIGSYQRNQDSSASRVDAAGLHGNKSGNLVNLD
jgi:hypothetical protein